VLRTENLQNLNALKEISISLKKIIVANLDQDLITKSQKT
jgi:hypothetical protein